MPLSHPIEGMAPHVLKRGGESCFRQSRGIRFTDGLEDRLKERPPRFISGGDAVVEIKDKGTDHGRMPVVTALVWRSQLFGASGKELEVTTCRTFQGVSLNDWFKPRSHHAVSVPPEAVPSALRAGHLPASHLKLQWPRHLGHRCLHRSSDC